MVHHEISTILKDIEITGVVLDRSGNIVELSDGWKARAAKSAAHASVNVGDNYFERCIRPDPHSIELLRGFKNLLERKIDFFSTICRQQGVSGTEWLLVVAFPKSVELPVTVVLHIDISVALRGRSDLSALMVGMGDAASAQLDAAITSTVRRAIAETLSRPKERYPNQIRDTGGRDEKQLDRLSKSQVELLAYLARGMSNLEIAKARGISVNTVKAQVATVIQKLDVANRTQAALFAARNNIDLNLHS
ncbi:MAG: response regulator transcription factor [Rhodopseudomonas sp.]|uniref:helix-turn-helix transcriptional regulator n=1 Tax=Rhodopseudomonas sp. TaxID=1078 RepID=UPI00181FDE15|nr:LuxR C-terminal-related transcriptional regulator [Rhodopseudomonas sp.]NVN88143.1 response regulator transcription factor [Rhodopseudomonas sp.]